jgi:prolyl oligopeptidase
MSAIKKAQLHYPSGRQEAVVDSYHGVPVTDPYRWLEDPESRETRSWVAAQNELTQSLLAQVPAREHLKRRLASRWDYSRVDAPVVKGERLFYTRNDGLQNQSVLTWRDGDQGEPVPLVDPNELSADGTVSLITWAPDRAGVRLAYGLSSSGSDWQELRVRRVADGQDMPEVLHWCKFTSIAWKPDGSGFYYCRFPEDGAVPAEEQFSTNFVCWHELGTAQEQDEVVFSTPEIKDFQYWPLASEDGETLLLVGSRGTDSENVVYHRPMNGSGAFSPLFDRLDATYTFITNVGQRFYFVTNRHADAGCIIAVDLERPEEDAWQVIVPEAGATLDFAIGAAGHLVVVYLEDARHRLQIFDLEGRQLGEVPLPGMGSIQQLTGRLDQATIHFTFASFLLPPTVYRFSVPDRMLQTFAQPEVGFDAERFETRQLFFTSRDGTRVPMFVTHKKGLPLDGSNPTLLYGYGGFSISQTPAFSVNRTLWLEDGGVYAVANLRGGEEYGEAWHRAGMLENKQNVFDDFIAAAEHLIAQGYTTPERLAINGRSNGGLLVAACMLQRPELFGAVVCTVPVIDMLRYHRFTVGRYWVGEYGNAEQNPDHFSFMISYSPLHNVRPNVAYPPLLLTTAETDDRVVPAHAMKFAATMQAASGNDRPVLIRIETRAGHGLGKPTMKLIEEEADILAFLYDVLGVDG